MMTTPPRRLTMAQALVRVPGAAAHVARRAGAAALRAASSASSVTATSPASAQALLEAPDRLRYYLPRNEQAMVHTAVGLRQDAKPAADARLHQLDRARRDEHDDRRRGRDDQPRCRCCCCPATSSRRAARLRCCSSSSRRQSQDVSVNDCFKPVSRYWDRINRPEQIVTALPEAMRVPDVPGRNRRGHARAAAGRAGRGLRLSRRRSSSRASGPFRAAAAGSRAGCARPRALIRQRARAADHRRRRRDLQRGDRRAARVRRSDRHRRSARRRRARARCPSIIRRRSARSAPPARPAANRLARDADLVIASASRLSDFTTASKTAFQHAGVRFITDQRRGARRRQARRAAAGRRRARDARGAAAAARPAMARRRTSYRGAVASREERSGSAKSIAILRRVDDADAQPGRRSSACSTTSLAPTRRHRLRRGQPAGRSAQAVAGPRSEAAITSSTATRAWATRSPAASASRWPRPTARSTCWSATGRT